MFLQILDWLQRFVNLLNDREKLSTSSKRRKVGKRLVQLHSLLLKTVSNAAKIRRLLLEVRTSLETFDGSLDGTCYLAGGPPFSLYLFHHALGEQRVCLKDLQSLLRDCKDLIDVYGENCGEQIARITGIKVSLIDLLTHLCLHNAPYVDFHFSGWSAIYLPKSLDLNDIEVYRTEPLRRLETSYTHLDDGEASEAERLRRWGWESVYELAWRENRPPQDLFAFKLGADRKADEELLERLLSQIDNIEVVKRLEEAEKTVATIIKSFFKIEELF